MSVNLKERVIECTRNEKMSRVQLETYLNLLVNKNLPQGNRPNYFLKVLVKKETKEGSDDRLVEILYWRPRRYTLLSFKDVNIGEENKFSDPWKNGYKIYVNHASLWEKLPFLGCPNPQSWTINRIELIQAKTVGVEDNYFYYSKTLVKD